MRIAILGCCGRMGRTNVEAVILSEDFELVGGTMYPEHPDLGQDLGLMVGLPKIDVVVTSAAQQVIKMADAVIEFSTPLATLAHAKLCAAEECPHVIGTTGFSDAENAALKSLSDKNAIVLAANMSLGVNILLSLVEQVAGRLDEEFDIEISEVHHRHKVDAPSGTALALGRAAAHGRSCSFDDVSVFGRHGLTGTRKKGAIGFAVSRGGDNVGEHEVAFAGEGERLLLRHVSTSRKIYAKGALHAAKWLRGRAPGLYSMRDVLTLDS